jgi:phosphatidylglycerophosphate synthase
MSEQDLDKQDNGLLVPFERWMGKTGLPFVPQCVSANQLTLLSGLAGILSGAAFYMATFDKIWFWVAAILVFMHWALDNIDGHVARARNQCSQAGRFLDIFLDSVTFAAIGIGLAFAGYTNFRIIAVATILFLLQYILTVLWIALTRVWPFPFFGPAEGSLTVIVFAIAMTVIPTRLLVLGNLELSLFDIGYAVTIPSSIISMIVSAWALYRHLLDRTAEEKTE